MLIQGGEVRAPDSVRRERLVDVGYGSGDFHGMGGGRGAPAQRPPPIPSPFDEGAGEAGEAGGAGQAGAGAQNAAQDAPAGAGGGGGGASGGTALEQLFAAPTDLSFNGTFDQAKELALQQGRWLLANVQDNEFPSHMLNRDTWAHELVKDTLRNSFVFFQAHTADNDPEGAKISTYYRLSSFPATLLIDPVTGAKVKLWGGFVGPDALLEDLMAYLDKSPVAPPARKIARGGNGPSMGVHGGAVGRSAAAEAANADAEAKEAAAFAAEAEAVARLEAARAALPAEPEKGAPGGCKLAVRFPDGHRVQRRFPSDATPAALHAFCAVELETGKALIVKESMPGAQPLDLNSDKTLAELRLNGVQVVCAFK